MFWTMLCGRRVADGRWWTSWLTAPSAGWPLNDPKCAPCWLTAAAPGCSSACERKPPTCPRYSAVALLARIKIRNIRNCQLKHHLAAIRPRVLGKASMPAQKVRVSSTVEAALFRAVGVDPVVHRALREVGQPRSATESVAAAGHYPADRSGFRRHTRLRPTRTGPHLPLEVSVSVPAPNRRALQRGCRP